MWPSSGLCAGLTSGTAIIANSWNKYHVLVSLEEEQCFSFNWYSTNFLASVGSDVDEKSRLCRSSVCCYSKTDQDSNAS